MSSITTGEGLRSIVAMRVRSAPPSVKAPAEIPEQTTAETRSETSTSNMLGDTIFAQASYLLRNLANCVQASLRSKKPLVKATAGIPVETQASTDFPETSSTQDLNHPNRYADITKPTGFYPTETDKFGNPRENLLQAVEQMGTDRHDLRMFYALFYLPTEINGIIAGKPWDYPYLRYIRTTPDLTVAVIPALGGEKIQFNQRLAAAYVLGADIAVGQQPALVAQTETWTRVPGRIEANSGHYFATRLVIDKEGVRATLQEREPIDVTTRGAKADTRINALSHRVYREVTLHQPVDTSGNPQGPLSIELTLNLVRHQVKVDFFIHPNSANQIRPRTVNLDGRQVTDMELLEIVHQNCVGFEPPRDSQDLILGMLSDLDMDGTLFNYFGNLAYALNNRLRRSSTPKDRIAEMMKDWQKGIDEARVKKAKNE